MGERIDQAKGERLDQAKPDSLRQPHLPGPKVGHGRGDAGDGRHAVVLEQAVQVLQVPAVLQLVVKQRDGRVCGAGVGLGAGERRVGWLVGGWEGVRMGWCGGGVVTPGRESRLWSASCLPGHANPATCQLAQPALCRDAAGMPPPPPGAGGSLPPSGYREAQLTSTVQRGVDGDAAPEGTLLQVVISRACRKSDEICACQIF